MLFLAIIALVAAMWFVSWCRRADSERRKKVLTSMVLYGLPIILLILFATGRIHWLTALFAWLTAAFSAALPWINRALMLGQLWQRFNASARQAAHDTDYTEAPRAAEQPPPPPPALGMSVHEALEILGLEPDADEQEIITAHKRLMQRIHPDKGGTSYLASRINQAREVLLNRFA